MVFFKIKSKIYKILKGNPSIDYKKHVSKNQEGFKYLPWAVCWDKLKTYYPNAKHEWVMYEYGGNPFGGIMQPDGSVIIHVKIHYGEENNIHLEHNEYLAVRNNNVPIINPNAQDMEKTYRRALGKAISTLTGFGLELWMDNHDKKNQKVSSKENLKMNGKMTHKQKLKLNYLINDANITKDDREKLQAMKNSSWEGINRQMASLLISDIMKSIKINKKI